MPFTPLTNNQDNKKQTDSDLLECAKNSLIDVLGETAEHIDPLFLKNRTLTVACANSDIAQELRGKIEEVIVKINDKLGKNEVDRIRYLL